METKPKNRAWVKDAAIVFLVVLLLLTFFSNTIMNHSLPEVATQMVTDGTITAKVRGTGTVAAKGSHKVKAKANETIGRVMVKAGQEVSAGDVLFVLGPGDSDQLEEAKAALDDLQTQYAQAALSVPLADQCISQYNAWKQAERALVAAEKAKTAAENERESGIGEDTRVKTLLAEKKSVEEELSAATQKLEAEKLVLSSIQKVLDDAMSHYNKVYTNWKRSQYEVPEVTDPKDDGGSGGAGSGGDTSGGGAGAGGDAGEENKITDNSNTGGDTQSGSGIGALGEVANVLFRPFASVGTKADEPSAPEEGEPPEVTAARENVNKLQAEYKERENDIVSDPDDESLNGHIRVQYIVEKQYKVDALTLKLKAINAELSNLSGDDANYAQKLEAYNQAKEDCDAKQDAYYKALASNERSIASASAGLGSISNKIKRQQEKIKQLTGEGDENTVTANVSGTVTEVNCTAGDAVLKDDILCAIEVPDMGYTVSFSVTNDQAKRLRVGDTATISNYYWGNQIVATLSTIQTDKKNPMSNKLLTFDLDGDVTSGSEITVSVGQKSARYDLIIPNSAIRTDSNGSFVLAVMAKSSPLGNRYVAKRVAIEVLAADDTNSAVTADLSNGDYVITTSSAPIANGDMVRMADAQS